MTKFPLIHIESPYASHSDALRYLACCILDSTLRGECPVASHVIFPLALPEFCEAYFGKTGREIGLENRDVLAKVAELFGLGCVRYVDLGNFPAMNRPGKYQPDRTLQGESKTIWDRGDWPTLARLTRNH